MLAPCTFTNLPALPVRHAYISNEAYNLLIAQGQRMYARWNTPPRATLARSDFRYSPVANGWLLRQETLVAQILAGERRVVSQEEFLAYERRCKYCQFNHDRGDGFCEDWCRDHYPARFPHVFTDCKQQVEKPQPVEPDPQPDPHQTFTYSAVAFHGWPKLAWYLVGFLDNVCHIGRVGA